MLKCVGFINYSLFSELQVLLESTLYYIKTLPVLSLICSSLCFHVLWIIKNAKRRLSCQFSVYKIIQIQITKVCLRGECAHIYSVYYQVDFYSKIILCIHSPNHKPFQGIGQGTVSLWKCSWMNIFITFMGAFHLLLTLASSSFSMSSLDVENSLRVILGVLSPWPTEPIISCSFSWFTSAYMLIQGIFLRIYEGREW